MSFKKSAVFAVLPLLFSVHAARASVEPVLVQSLASALLSCVEQPYGVNSHTGNKVFGLLRSHCAHVAISNDRANVKIDGRTYAVLIKNSENSDGGDLNDLFIQYDAREDQEVQVASNILAFGDPALSLLLISGHRAEELPQILDPALSQ